MVNAKKSISSWQLARDLDLTHQTALFIQQRIRAGMALEQHPLLQGILEADEVYIEGKRFETPYVGGKGSPQMQLGLQDPNVVR